MRNRRIMKDVISCCLFVVVLTTIVLAQGPSAAEARDPSVLPAAVAAALDAASPPVSFRRDVIPMLARHGCSAGGCHGAATGKNGFRLSLFGFDPESDWRRLTRESRGRRVDLVEPTKSLMLLKPLGKVTHKGGVKLHIDDEAYRVFREWISAGAMLDDSSVTITKLELEPADCDLALGGPSRRAVIRAHWSDDHVTEVNSRSTWSTSDELVAVVDQDGNISPKGVGEAVILARHASSAAALRVIVRDPKGPETARPATVAEIDRLVDAKLARLSVAPTPLADDHVFIRRATLDINGRLPTVEEAKSFVADPSPEKYSQLVDRLLEREEWSKVWSLPWLEAMRIDTLPLLTRKGVEAFTDDFRAAIRSGEPFDRLVRRMLTSSGGHYTSPEVGYYLVDSDPKTLAEMTAQVFMGVRIQCAQCHNHPFDRWTMDDYYGFTAFFARVGSKVGDDPRERIVFERGDGDVKHPKDGRVMAPKFLGGETPKLGARDPRRPALAVWLTAPENPWFASNTANRLFSRFFGRGIVEPVDDVRLSNPPSHPELLDYLARRIVETNYDIKAIVREITSTRAYRSATAEDRVATLFGGSAVRRLGAEELHESIVCVTGVPTKFFGLDFDDGAFDVEDGDPSSYFLDVFGRPRRTSSCSCERRDEPTLGQALHLINGGTIAEKLRSNDGRLKQLLREQAGDDAILDALFWSAYSRPAKPEEKQRIVEELAATPKEREAVWEDVWWSVLNSHEFTFTR